MMPHYIFIGLPRREKNEFLHANFKNTANWIISTVSKNIGVSSKEVLSASREQKTVFVRYIIWYRLTNDLKLTSVFIGKLFKRDHSTVLHGLKEYDNLKGNPLFENMLVRADHPEVPAYKVKYKAVSSVHPAAKSLGIQNKYIDRPTHKL